MHYGTRRIHSSALTRSDGNHRQRFLHSTVLFSLLIESECWFNIVEASSSLLYWIISVVKLHFHPNKNHSELLRKVTCRFYVILKRLIVFIGSYTSVLLIYIEYEIIIRSDNMMVWMFETVCARIGSSFTRHILYLWYSANDCFFTIGFLNGSCHRQWCSAVRYIAVFSIAHKFITRFVINVRLLNNGRVPFGDSGKRRKNGSLVGKQATGTVRPRSLIVKCVPATNTRRWNFLQYSSPVMTANGIS